MLIFAPDMRIGYDLQEILCRIPAYQPPNKPGGSPHLELGSPEAHIDTHFRLLRQDLIGPLASSVQSFVDAGGIAEVAHASKRPKLQNGNANELAIYLHAHIIALVTESPSHAPCDIQIQVIISQATDVLR